MKTKRFLEIDIFKDGVHVLLVEDDIFLSRDYAMCLESIGRINVYETNDPQIAINTIWEFRDVIDYVILDIRLPYFMLENLNEQHLNVLTNKYTYLNDEYDVLLNHENTCDGFRTGCVLYKEISDIAPDIKIIGLSNTSDAINKAIFELNGDQLFYKPEAPPILFAKIFKNHYMQSSKDIQTFIVHGHDQLLLLELKNYIQNTLKLPEPIILSERQTKGRTVIEKFEDYANKADIVFSLLTPDDTMHDNAKHARQNVLFELGYFMGKIGRQSGRVFLLHKNETEIPSDLRGIIYIDVSNGIASSGEAIRLELNDFL